MVDKQEQPERYQLLVARNYTEEQFRKMWHDEYIVPKIYTHDNIRVHFYDDNFDHAFYESSGRNVSRKSPLHKDTLSYQRLSRMLWIKDVLSDPEAKMVMGYDSKTKTYVDNKRVSIVKGDYVVVIQLYGDYQNAKFITAYVANNSIDKILSSPEWTQKKR